MRLALRALLCLSTFVLVGCGMLDPNSRLNVNRGTYQDEYLVGDEARAGEPREKDYEDGLDYWLHSPKYRAINRDLGAE
jgi:hypothetical protein